MQPDAKVLLGCWLSVGKGGGVVMRLNECVESAFSPSAKNTVRGRLWKKKSRREKTVRHGMEFF
jgi:hypothetical protein